MSAPPILSKSLWKTCTGCGVPKDIKEFNGIHGEWCKDCRVAYRKPGNKPWPSDRTSRLKEAVNKIVAELSHGQANAVTLTAFASGLIAEFGGVQAAVRSMYEEFNKAVTDERPSRKVILDWWKLMMTIIGKAQEERVQFNMGALAEKDLDDLIYGLLVERMEDSGVEETLASLAAAKGYKLVPADPPALTIESQAPGSQAPGSPPAASEPAPAAEPAPEGVPEFEEDTDDRGS